MNYSEFMWNFMIADCGVWSETFFKKTDEKPLTFFKQNELLLHTTIYCKIHDC